MQTTTQVASYSRALLVRAVDPLTRGALRARLGIVGTTLHLRSFLDPPKPHGHTIKGSGLVEYSPNRKNTKTVALSFTLRRACDKNLAALGVLPCDYNYGRAEFLKTQAVISINGRR
jgi:hypothetical protein